MNMQWDARLAAAAALCCLRVPMQDAPPPPVDFHWIASSVVRWGGAVRPLRRDVRIMIVLRDGDLPNHPVINYLQNVRDIDIDCSLC